MTRSRASIGWLMLAVALIGFHLAVVCAYSPAFGLDNLEVGLLPGVTVLTVMLFSTSGRRVERSRPFVRGFMASLTVAICVYVVCCLTIPDLVRWPIVYYLNEIEPYLYGADLTVIYRLSLEIHGLIVGLPQLLFALAGGVVTKAIAIIRRDLNALARPGNRRGRLVQRVGSRQFDRALRIGPDRGHELIVGHGSAPPRESGADSSGLASSRASRSISACRN